MSSLWNRVGKSVLLAMLVVAGLANADVTATDYARAERMLGWHAGKLVYNLPVSMEWLDNSRFWYRKQIKAGQEFVFVDAKANVQRPAFDHARLATVLSQISGTAYEPYKLPFTRFEYMDNMKAIRFWEARPASATDNNPSSDKQPQHRMWTCLLSNYQCDGPANVGPQRKDESISPDGKWATFVRDENLWVRSVASGEERQLSRDGVTDYGYGVPAEGCCYEVSQKRAGTQRPPEVVWSPDSGKIATWRLDERKVEDMHLLETSGARPILHSYKYALPGDKEVPVYTVHVFDLNSKQQVDIATDPVELYWGADGGRVLDVRWNAASDTLFFKRIFRGFQKAVIYRADAATGKAKSVVEEISDTFIDSPKHHDQARDRDLQEWRLVNSDQDIVWWSERDGWGHFYLYDAQTGKLKNQITSGPWVTQDIYVADDDRQWLYFSGLGREKSDYPYAKHLYRVKYDGSRLQRLSQEDQYREINPSADGSYFIDTYSTRKNPPVTVLRNRDGKVIKTLETADISALLATGWKPAEQFTVKARDGVTDLHGFIYRPTNFDPDKTYPIVDRIYPGPQIGPVRHKGFTASPGGETQALAELGFVVIQLDAMGTPYRSKEFHDVWYGNMADNGLIDHVNGIKQLAARYPEIDIERVGIYGHSGGGFSSTGAILRFPDFFKVAVSGAGNHDNRSYSWGWGEKYQGMLKKNADGSDNYDSQANHLLAQNLKGHLLLHYGTLDDNVHPHATLLLVDELIKHNKDFDLMVLPNGNHGYASDNDVLLRYITRKTWDYFVTHLRGETPPAGYYIEPRPR